MVRGQCEDNQKLISQVKIKIPDMSTYFPLPDSATLARFLDESDGMYEHRTAELENLLILCLSNKKNLFGTSLINTFFSTSYINTHSWPTTG